tara:strand:+ start:79 stop:258 length:180 start_codon:yes stop_codon:yes gene_type:complete
MQYNITEQEAKQKKLDEDIKKFLDKGGKIEIIPPGMTGEQYYSSGLAPKKKGRKKKSTK